MRIDKAEVIVTSPDRNFVTLKLTTDDGLTGLGDATLNGRELAVVAYLREHVVPLLIGRDASPDRGHLAVPLPQRLLAARPGDHGRHRRGRHGALGHQGQGRRHAGLPAARRRVPHRPARLRARLGQATCRSCSTACATHQEQGYRAIRIQTGGAGAEVDLRHRLERHLRGQRRACATTTNRPSAAACRTRRTGTPAPTCGTCRPCSRRSATSSAPRSRCCTTATTG